MAIQHILNIVVFEKVLGNAKDALDTRQHPGESGSDDSGATAGTDNSDCITQALGNAQALGGGSGSGAGKEKDRAAYRKQLAATGPAEGVGCSYTTWSTWGCNVACGGGVELRSRRQISPKCFHSRRTFEFIPCNTFPCGQNSQRAPCELIPAQDAQRTLCTSTCCGGLKLRAPTQSRVHQVSVNGRRFVICLLIHHQSPTNPKIIFRPPVRTSWTRRCGRRFVICFQASCPDIMDPLVWEKICYLFSGLLSGHHGPVGVGEDALCAGPQLFSSRVRGVGESSPRELAVVCAGRAGGTGRCNRRTSGSSV